MKRYRRMMPIGSLTDTMIKQNHSEPFREAVLLGIPAKVLGPEIAQRIAKVEVVENSLLIHIPDEAWRKELSGRKSLILRKAREVLTTIQRVEMVE